MLILFSCNFHSLPIIDPVLSEKQFFLTKTNTPTLPKIRKINWRKNLLPLIHQILILDNIQNGALILINFFKNNTNGVIQTQEATVVLINLFKQIDKFKIIGVQQFNTARQKLKLSVNDNFESCSKAIGLAKYLNAQYVVYGIVTGNINKPAIELQILSVKTGEIIWFGTNNIKY